MPTEPILISLLPALAKGSIVLTVVALAMALTGKRILPAARHILWVLGFAGCLLLLGFVNVRPWQIHFPLPQSPSLELETTPQAVIAPEMNASLPRSNNPSSISTSPAVSAVSSKTPDSSQSKPSWPGFLGMLWLAGALFMLVRLGISALFLAIRSRDWRPSRSYQNHLPRVHRLLRTLGIHRPVRVLISPKKTSPATWGFFRANIALPMESSQWTEDKLRMVVAHEVSHLKRRDTWSHLLIQLGLATQWFHPLAWWGARRAACDRELACDAAALKDHSINRKAYAELLLDFARGGRRPFQSSTLALAMSSRDPLLLRLQAIAHPSPRRYESGKVRVGLLAGAVLLFILILAFVTVRTYERPSGPRLWLGEREPQTWQIHETPTLPLLLRAELTDAEKESLLLEEIEVNGERYHQPLFQPTFISAQIERSPLAMMKPLSKGLYEGKVRLFPGLWKTIPPPAATDLWDFDTGWETRCAEPLLLPSGEHQIKAFVRAGDRVFESNVMILPILGVDPPQKPIPQAPINTPPLASFLNQPTAEPVTVRALIKQSDYFNYQFTQDNGYACFALRCPQSSEIIFGYTPQSHTLGARLAIETGHHASIADVTIAFPPIRSSNNQVLIKDAHILPNPAEQPIKLTVRPQKMPHCEDEPSMHTLTGPLPRNRALPGFKLQLEP